MSLHKLSAGHGYDYLIRQVAALDATHRGRTDLASYYTERGEALGRWVGRGLAGVDGLDVGDAVTGEQMRLLFAEGTHPLAETSPGGGRVLALGVPYRPSTGEQPFQAALRARFADHNTALGLPRRTALPAEVRARLRGELAAEWFRQQEGRDPKGDLELASALARWSRPAAAAVGGYDLTFSPVKSVSTLWAFADLPVAAQIEQAHHAAVAEALRFIEDRALFTREGTGGVRQVNVTGLVAAAFTHRDSRAGDPDVHTHVAVANKVQTLGGRWLSIDVASCTPRRSRRRRRTTPRWSTTSPRSSLDIARAYGGRADAGVRFAERPGGDRSKRPVREIVGVDPRLNQRWSARRQVIDVRRAELAAAFAQDHGRPPGRVEMLHLSQHATLETRDRKHEPRTLMEQRSVWRTEAVETLGGDHAVAVMLQQALNLSVTADPVVIDALRAETADRKWRRSRSIARPGSTGTFGPRPSVSCAAAPSTQPTPQTWPRRLWRRHSTDQSDSRRSMGRPVCRTTCAGPMVGRCSPSPAVTSTPRPGHWRSHVSTAAPCGRMFAEHGEGGGGQLWAAEVRPGYGRLGKSWVVSQRRARVRLGRSEESLPQ
jgi:hypothetical protein